MNRGVSLHLVGFITFGGERPHINSVARSRPFNLLVFQFWSIFSHGPKRLTFLFLGPLGK